MHVTRPLRVWTFACPSPAQPSPSARMHARPWYLAVCGMHAPLCVLPCALLGDGALASSAWRLWGQRVPCELHATGHVQLPCAPVGAWWPRPHPYFGPPPPSCRTWTRHHAAKENPVAPLQSRSGKRSSGRTAGPLAASNQYSLPRRRPRQLTSCFSVLAGASLPYLPTTQTTTPEACAGGEGNRRKHGVRSLQLRRPGRRAGRRWPICGRPAGRAPGAEG